MSDFRKDLENVETTGKQVLSDYNSGKGFDSGNLQKAGAAAEKLVQDYEGKSGQSSGAVEGALGQLSKTEIGREIEGNVAKQAIKSEAQNALKSGNISGIAEDLAGQFK